MAIINACWRPGFRVSIIGNRLAMGTTSRLGEPEPVPRRRPAAPFDLMLRYTAPDQEGRTVTPTPRRPGRRRPFAAWSTARHCENSARCPVIPSYGGIEVAPFKRIARHYIAGGFWRVRTADLMNPADILLCSSFPGAVVRLAAWLPK